VTINHEINNPLTAILGNAQLLLMAKDKLPPDIVSKLETIERSAVRIRETTSKLMSIIEPVTSSYVSGLEMIDIEKSKKKKNQ
jgi:signal transduction histidine kinase